MAPEVLRDFESYSFPADIWSLGALISFICNEKHLFMSEFDVMNFGTQVLIILDQWCPIGLPLDKFVANERLILYEHLNVNYNVALKLTLYFNGLENNNL